MNDQKTKALTRAEDFLTLLESVHLRIVTKEQAANALLYSKKLREFADAIDERVKKRAFEIMGDEDIKMIEVGDWRITKIEPSESREYKTSSLIEAVGLERAMPFLKVNGAKMAFYIKKQGMTPAEAGKAQEGAVLKQRKGYIRIYEMKNDANSNSQGNS